jgi:hypothetical protein
MFIAKLPEKYRADDRPVGALITSIQAVRLCFFYP